MTTESPHSTAEDSLTALIAERDALLADMREIDTDLGQTRRTHEGGAEYSKEEFQTWRRAAKHARTKKLNRYTEIKELLRQRGVDRADPLREYLASIDERMGRAVELLQQILEAQFEPDPEITIK